MVNADSRSDRQLDIHAIAQISDYQEQELTRRTKTFGPPTRPLYFSWEHGCSFYANYFKQWQQHSSSQLVVIFHFELTKPDSINTALLKPVLTFIKANLHSAFL